MFERWSLKFPITLGVTMIILIVALIVGWVILTAYNAVQSQQAGFFWMLLSVGSVFFAILLTGVIFYLTLSVKAINLTRRQSNFIDSVTHELKSPIASLKLYLQTLDMRDVSPEEQARFLRFMMDDVERLDNLITHLLEAGYAEKMREHESVAAVDIAEVIRQAVRSVTLRYRVDTEVVKLDLEPCLISMPLVDAAMIFRNLIITDNGQGIPETQRRKIFGRFVRLGKELRREKPGTGLGTPNLSTKIQTLKPFSKYVCRGDRYEPPQNRNLRLGWSRIRQHKFSKSDFLPFHSATDQYESHSGRRRRRASCRRH